VIIETRAALRVGAAMGENVSQQVVFALGLGIFLSLAFDDPALGLALGFGLVFGLGLFSGKKD
jgi:hypothetical protein